MAHFDQNPAWLRALLSSPEYQDAKKQRARNKPSKKTFFAGKNKGKKGKKMFKRKVLRHRRGVLGLALHLRKQQRLFQEAS